VSDIEIAHDFSPRGLSRLPLWNSIRTVRLANRTRRASLGLRPWRPYARFLGEVNDGWSPGIGRMVDSLDACRAAVSLGVRPAANAARPRHPARPAKFVPRKTGSG
jgi:hypothetical protein